LVFPSPVLLADTSLGKRHVPHPRTGNHSFLAAISPFSLKTILTRNRGTLRPAKALVPSLRYRTRKHETLTAARFVLDGQVLPAVSDTIYLAELARKFLQGVFGRLFENEQSEMFSGKDIQGKPIAGHRHAFFLPTDEDGDGRLDHITIHCAGGFGDRELRALDTWRRLRQPGGGIDLSLVLVGLIRKSDQRDAASIALLRNAKLWQSITLLLPPAISRNAAPNVTDAALSNFQSSSCAKRSSGGAFLPQ